MKFAVIVFPGSDEKEMYYAVKDILGEEVELINYKDENSLENYDAILLPGGFSYGDYLRSGALAARTDVIEKIRSHAEKGKPVLGIGNGFQVLTEAGILPGAFVRNQNITFISQLDEIIVENNESMFTSAYGKGEVVTFPISHGHGNYYCDEQTLGELKANNQIVFKYKNNPNGSVEDIAGIINKDGNVLGMMPHPERATEQILGSEDGLKLFQSVIENWRQTYVTN